MVSSGIDGQEVVSSNLDQILDGSYFTYISYKNCKFNLTSNLLLLFWVLERLAVWQPAREARFAGRVLSHFLL